MPTLRIANLDQTSTYNLLSAAICVRAVGRISSTTQEGLIEERFMMYGKGTEIAIMNALIELDTFTEKVRLWHSDKTKPDSIWLEESATNEADRRSLIFSIKINRGSEGGVNPLLNFPNLVGELIITRHWAWESIASRTTTVTIDSGMWHGTRVVPTYAEDIVLSVFTFGINGSYTILEGDGTLPGRIADVTISNATNTGVSNYINRLWVGIKPLYEGYSTFAPDQRLGNGTLGTDTTGSYPLIVNFATTSTLTNRVTLSVEQMTSSEYNSFLGTFLVLLNYGVDGTASIGVWLTQSGVFRDDEKFLEDTGGLENVMEMGVISFPLNQLRSLSGTIDIRKMNLGISAERISGTGNLHLYSVTLIPINHFFKVEDCQIDSTHSVTIYTQENDQIETLAYNNADYFNEELFPQPSNWQVPIEGGILVASGAQAEYQDLLSYFDIEIISYDRWKNYRGT